jgi:maltooligosyltrehalose trehalohydrolase
MIGPGELWAPFATKVGISVRGETLPMIEREDGWWVASGIPLRPGDDYSYFVNDEGPFPDPRSQFQPSGPHAASRVVDHSSFRWTDDRWQAKPLSSAVIYELHVGTFSPHGTFDGAIQRLDHLVELGITHVELMPVAEFAGEHGWGYDGVSLYAPHHAYGGPDGLKRLVNACHDKGLAVLLDVVYNHLGPSGNYLPKFGPYFTGKYQTPWGPALNFDGPASHEVRRFVIDNALMWLRDYHFDGLRLDAVHAIVDLSALHILEELAAEVDALEARSGRPLVLIAESDLNDPRLVRPAELGGYGLDAQWCDDVHHAIHTTLTGEREGYYADFGSLEDLSTAMQQPYVYAGRHSVVRGRTHGRPPTGLTSDRFVVFLQNHDQVGNRAQGERIGQLTNLHRAKIGAALILLSPYVPMLFQGEEWASSSPFQYFVDFQKEPDLAKAVREGRRAEFASFGWKPEEVPDPTSGDSISVSRLRWEELNQQPHAEILDWYRSLIALRREVAPRGTGQLQSTTVRHDGNRNWLVVQRQGLVIACNFSTREEAAPVGEEGLSFRLTSRDGVRLDGGILRLPPESVAVLSRVVSPLGKLN